MKTEAEHWLIVGTLAFQRILLESAPLCCDDIINYAKRMEHDNERYMEM